jgi:hypothetical protein
VTILALTPFVVTVLLLGEVYRKDHEQQILDTMSRQLVTTTERLDQLLQSVVRDLQFVAGLDVMNDILSGDLDKRITNLLILKKQDLHLIGSIDVVDTNNVVVASSEAGRLGAVKNEIAFSSVPISSTFSDQTIGSLKLYYAKENLSRLFPAGNTLQYELQHSDKATAASPEALQVSKALANYPGYSVS